ncbi:MAG: type II toxin-antitoxin system RelE/ParE family toxin [Candidatus Geothermarchaeales archaeon]
MKYRLNTTSRFERDFRRFSPKLKGKIDSSIRRLEDEPYLGKPLRGELKGRRSLRIGRYRIIYIIDEDEKAIILLTVGRRGAVYKRSRQRLDLTWKGEENPQIMYFSPF